MSDTTIDIYNLSFTNRATYLLWRAAWRRAYADLSVTIRNNKHDRNALFQTGESAAVMQKILRRQRAAASELLELRLTSKTTAQAQYQAARAAPSAQPEARFA
jgi:hypothetical protein